MKTIVRNSLLPTFNSFFDDFVTRDFTPSNRWNESNWTTPSVNIRQNENEYTLEVAAPGYQKNDFKVEINDNILTISSERKHEESEENNGQITRKEFSYASFERRFNLPENVVDEEKIHASYENGILQITLPKREEVKPRPARMIDIQ